MRHYLTSCTAGSTSSYADPSSATEGSSNTRGDTGPSDDNDPDPLLDLNSLEEAELPHLTVATLGGTDKVSVLVMETRVQGERLEGMLAVGVDGCRSVLGMLDAVVRGHGRVVLEGRGGGG